MKGQGNTEATLRGQSAKVPDRKARSMMHNVKKVWQNNKAVYSCLSLGLWDDID